MTYTVVKTGDTAVGGSVSMPVWTKYSNAPIYQVLQYQGQPLYAALRS
jgi:hypothetical protein